MPRSGLLRAMHIAPIVHRTVGVPVGLATSHPLLLGLGTEVLFKKVRHSLPPAFWLPRTPRTDRRTLEQASGLQRGSLPLPRARSGTFSRDGGRAGGASGTPNEPCSSDSPRGSPETSCGAWSRS